MNIRIQNFKTHDSHIYLKVMNYIDEVIKTSSICGDFNFVNISKIKIAHKYGLTTTDSNGIIKMSSVYYDCISVLTYLGVLVKSDNYEMYTKATLYCIDKQLFLILYSLLLSLDLLTKKQIDNLHRKNFGDNISDILIGIHDCYQNRTIYRNTLFTGIINRTCYTLATICELLIGRHEVDEYKLNQYVRNYIETNKGNSLKVTYQTALGINNGSIQMLPFWKELSKCWFTNSYLSEKRNDSMDSIEYYEKYLLRNKYIKPLISLLDKQYNKTELSDFEISKDDFKKIPGQTEEKKIEILCTVVKYWVIKNCSFLKYTLSIVDDLQCLDDNYKMNIHISVTREANQHGTYAYLVHFSCRMTNDLCKYRKAEHCNHYIESREYLLERNGFDSFLDLHSSIFTITRSLNHRIPLDLQYDIKKKLEELKIRGTIDGQRRLLQGKDFKGLIFYMFFNKGVKDAYDRYKNRYSGTFHKIKKEYEDYMGDDAMEIVLEEYELEKERLNKTVAKISERDFYKIYEFIQKETGGTTNFTCNIFVIESAIMALAIKKINKEKCAVKNVYDCVWWNSSEISREEIELILIEGSSSVFSKYYELSGSYFMNLSVLSSSTACEHMSC